MAKRPVFVSEHKSDLLCKSFLIEFEWFPGFSIKQKQKSILSLHTAINEKFPNLKILEISSKSNEQLGVDLSAFNLMITTKKNQQFSVESVFQGSKVFEFGGPYDDLYEKSSKEAKKDIRLKNSGNLIAFKYFKREFPNEPKTLFYNWLYINTLSTNKELSLKILDYDGFTDIEFNPDKSLNCQAEAAAIYISLVKNELLEKALSSFENFEEIVCKKMSKKLKINSSEQLKLL